MLVDAIVGETTIPAKSLADSKHFTPHKLDLRFEGKHAGVLSLEAKFEEALQEEWPDSPK